MFTTKGEDMVRKGSRGRQPSIDTFIFSADNNNKRETKYPPQIRRLQVFEKEMYIYNTIPSLSGRKYTQLCFKW